MSSNLSSLGSGVLACRFRPCRHGFTHQSVTFAVSVIADIHAGLLQQTIGTSANSGVRHAQICRALICEITCSDWIFSSSRMLEDTGHGGGIRSNARRHVHVFWKHAWLISCISGAYQERGPVSPAVCYSVYSRIQARKAE